MFQLTTIVMRGLAPCGEMLPIDLDRVAIAAREKGAVLLCVQKFVRSPEFNQIIFFSESSLTMLSESVTITARFTSSAVYVHGAVWKQYLQVRYWLICVLVGNKLTPVGGPQKISACDGTMVALPERMHHRGPGYRSLILLKRDIWNMY